jgi:hypothetical protein
MFSTVTSEAEFATVLGFPLSDVMGIAKGGCPFNAIHCNNNRCPAHQRNWCPLKHQRGPDMLGPEFMRFSMHKGHGTQPACKAAGYFPSKEGGIFIPRHARKMAFSTTNLFNQKKQDELKDTVNMLFYMWHFLPQHREASSTTIIC